MYSSSSKTTNPQGTTSYEPRFQYVLSIRVNPTNMPPSSSNDYDHGNVATRPGEMDSGALNVKESYVINPQVNDSSSQRFHGVNQREYELPGMSKWNS